MGSIRGLRCDHCHTEVLATASHAAVIGGAAWTYPVLCCGQPLRPLETGQVLSTTLPRRRVARCVGCGYEVCVIVHPARVLVCAICQADLVVGNADRAVATIGEAQVSGQVSRR